MVSDGVGPIGRNVVISVYVIIILACFLGNIIVVVIVIMRPLLHTATNYFILSLSVADILVGVVVVSFTLSHQISLQWLGGENQVVCTLPPFIELACVTASIYSLLFISIDKYRAIVLARKSRNTNHLRLQLVGIWVWSFVYASKIFLQNYLTGSALSDSLSDQKSNGSDNTEEKLEFCSFLAEEDEDDLPYRVADLLVLFVLPSSSMVYIFLHIRRRLWSSAVGVTTNVRKKRAVVRFLAIAILIFIFCWLPFYTLDIVTDSVKLMMDEEKAEALENGEVYNVTKFCVIILAFSNSLLNPFIYAFFNKNFINEARTICRGSRLRCFSVNRVGPGADSDETQESGTQGRQA